mmetsp:Transcript_235/g.473  ORF Transcript_235/g.473 Transcript_235/m.473 type:complete len:335 (+) Transcript_235:92-1096(+)
MMQAKSDLEVYRCACTDAARHCVAVCLRGPHLYHAAQYIEPARQRHGSPPRSKPDLGLNSNSNPLEHGRSAHPSANAHGNDTKPLACAVKLVQQRGNLARASAAERVTQGDGTTLGVDLGHVNAEFLNAVDRLAREGLVDLKDIDVIQAQTGLLDRRGDGLRRSDAHNIRGHAHDRVRTQSAQDGQAEGLCLGLTHHEYGSGPIADLTGVASGGRSILLEDWLQFTKLLRSRGRPNSVVRGHHRRCRRCTIITRHRHSHWHDLGVEKALRLRVRRLGVRGSRELVLGLPSHTKLGSDILGSDTHGHHAVTGTRVSLDDINIDGRHCRAHISARH